MTCPWRAFHDPLVQEVVRAAQFADDGNLAVVWGEDPPAEWLDGLRVYTQAKLTTRAHYMEKDRKARERERKA